MDIDSLINHIESQNDFILKLQAEVTDFKLKQTSLEAAFYILIHSIAESSVGISETLKSNAEKAILSLSQSGNDFPHLEKHLQIMSGKGKEKPPYLKLLKPRKK